MSIEKMMSNNAFLRGYILMDKRLITYEMREYYRRLDDKQILHIVHMLKHITSEMNKTNDMNMKTTETIYAATEELELDRVPDLITSCLEEDSITNVYPLEEKIFHRLSKVVEKNQLNLLKLPAIIRDDNKFK